MGFWDKLLKIGGVAAAPFTAGSSLLATGIGVAGDALGGMAEASANNRGAQIDAVTQAEILNQQRQWQHQEYALAREADKRASGKDVKVSSLRQAHQSADH